MSKLEKYRKLSHTVVIRINGTLLKALDKACAGERSTYVRNLLKEKLLDKCDGCGKFHEEDK